MKILTVKLVKLTLIFIGSFYLWKMLTLKVEVSVILNVSRYGSNIRKNRNKIISEEGKMTIRVTLATTTKVAIIFKTISKVYDSKNMSGMRSNNTHHTA